MEDHGRIAGGSVAVCDRPGPCELLARQLGADRVSLWRRVDAPAPTHTLVCGHPGPPSVGPLPDPSCAAHGAIPSGSADAHLLDGVATWCLPLPGGTLGQILVSGDEVTRDRLVAMPAELVRDVVRLLEDDGSCHSSPEALDENVLAALTADTTHDLEAILNGLRGRLARSGPACAISVLAPGSERPVPVLSDRVLTQGSLGDECATIAERAMRSGRLVVRTARAVGCPAPPRHARLQTGGFAALMASPLGRAGRVLGAIVVAVPSAPTVSEEEILAVRETASLVGVTFDRTRLEAEQQHRYAVESARRALLEAGVRSCSAIEAAEAIARTVAKALDVPVGCTYLVDKNKRITDLASVGVTPEQNETLRDRLIGRLGSDSPVWQHSIEVPEPGPYLLEDASVPGSTRPGGGMAQALGYRCLATIPLLSSDGPIGVVVCGDHRGPRRWSADEHALAAELAMQGTILLDNALLREAERHQAVHDELTGLLNRSGFQERLRQELARTVRSGEPLSIMILDLNRFKEINDTLGHGHGDLLLIEVAQRLNTGLRTGDVVARIGGDEFAVLLPETDSEEATVAAGHVEVDLCAPIRLAGRLVQVGASIGIATFPDHSDNATDLVRLADAAMYVAKRSGLPYTLVDTAIGESDRPGRLEQTTLLGELARAIGDDELVLQFQPKVAAGTGEVVGVEALVRWMHPRRGLLGPGDFVPLAERSGVIGRLTGWVVPQALQQCRAWLDRGFDLSVAVNVSAQDLTDPDFVGRVEEALQRSGVPGARLTIELTETALLLDLPGALRTLAGLRGLAVRSSLDDFGTGYSALSYLSTLPIDEFKLDGSFFRNGLPERAAVVLEGVIAMGHRLGLTVVGEGVETPELATRLEALGVDQIQGYVHAPGLYPAELLRWVEARGANHLV